MSRNQGIMKLFLVVLAISLVASLQAGSIMAATKSKPADGAAKGRVYDGTVMKTDRGIVLQTNEGEYLIKGKDLSNMVDKLIEASGTVSKSDKGNVIDITSFKEIQIITGTVVKTDRGYVIETDDGEYLAKGKDLSHMVDKLIEATGVFIETDKEDIIEVKSFEEIQE